MKRIIFSLLIASFLVACGGEPSLQKYYVENQDNSEFLMLDVPASLLAGAGSSLSAEQQEALETVRKVNLLAYPVKEDGREKYELERTEVENILRDEKYQQLMRFGGSGTGVQFYYVGNEDAIDEFVAYGSDNDRGFMVARILGDDMQVDQLFNLLESIKPEDVINIPGVKDFGMSLAPKSDSAVAPQDSIE